MTHASWNNERGQPSGPGQDNERLEYLGDAVLELVVGDYLFRRFPGYDEGQLTQLRAALVNTTSLARLAERLGLGDTLLLGKGAAKTGARKLPSLLANAFEALIGAAFVDQGFRAASRIFLQNIGDLAEWSDENFKGRLQEASQERTGDTPHYRVTAVGGPGHARQYSADVLLAGAVAGSGRGGTKQAAEQAAARDALARIEKAAPRPAAAAAGAARDAAKAISEEPARVRRRVAEVAADRGASAAGEGHGKQRRRRSQASASKPPEPAEKTPPGRKGLIAALRSAAEALVGRLAPEPPPPPEPEKKKRTRRGKRGGRGRGGKRATTATQDVVHGKD
ncbi:MAG: ribonuclease III [Candidatus Dormibacteraeota bacterium]|nr:ribonuclease III [Candidatus Dormibacteraeota bacterium]